MLLKMIDLVATASIIHETHTKLHYGNSFASCSTGTYDIIELVATLADFEYGHEHVT